MPLAGRLGLTCSSLEFDLGPRHGRDISCHIWRDGWKLWGLGFGDLARVEVQVSRSKDVLCSWGQIGL
jgi:hypothetical protein